MLRISHICLDQRSDGVVDHMKDWSRLWKMLEIISPSFNLTACPDILTTSQPPFWDDVDRFRESSRAHDRRGSFSESRPANNSRPRPRPNDTLQPTGYLPTGDVVSPQSFDKWAAVTLFSWPLRFDVDCTCLPKFASLPCQPSSAAPREGFQRLLQPFIRLHFFHWCSRSHLSRDGGSCPSQKFQPLPRTICIDETL